MKSSRWRCWWCPRRWSGSGRRPARSFSALPCACSALTTPPPTVPAKLDALADDVAFLDGYAQRQGMGSRSAALQKAVRLEDAASYAEFARLIRAGGAS